MTVAETQLTRVAEVLRAQGEVAALWLFGSRARGDARPASDVDLAVLLRTRAEESLRTRLRLQVVCADALGMPADRVDLVVLNDAPALLTHAVLREGRRLLDEVPALRVAFEEDALHRFVIAARLRDEAMSARVLRLAPETR